MKHILIILFLSFFQTLHLSAQAFEIRNLFHKNGALAIQIRAVETGYEINSVQLTDLTFGIKWKSNCELELSEITSDFHIDKSGSATAHEQYFFQAFYAKATPFSIPIALNEGTWVDVLFIHGLSEMSYCSFEICHPNFNRTTKPNIGINLIDYTPSLNSELTEHPTSDATENNVTPHQNKLSVYPNPATDELYVQFTALQNSPSTITIVDTKGVEHWNRQYNTSVGWNEVGFSINQLPAGSYFVQVKTDDSFYISRLLIAK